MTSFPFEKLPLDAQKVARSMMSSKTLGNLKSTNKAMYSAVDKSEITSTRGYKAAAELSAINLAKVNIVKNGVTLNTFYVYATPRISENNTLHSIQAREIAHDYKWVVIDADAVPFIKTNITKSYKFQTDGMSHTLGPIGKAMFNVCGRLINDRPARGSAVVKIIKRVENHSRLFYPFYENRVPPGKTLGMFVNSKTFKMEELTDSIERITVMKTIEQVLQMLKVQSDNSVKTVAYGSVASLVLSESQKDKKDKVKNIFNKASADISSLIHSIKIERKLYNELFMANSTMKSRSNSSSA